jgi:hypothetical protein
MKNIMAIIVVCLFSSCFETDTIKQHNEFLSLNEVDLANLDSLNAILFRNKDKISSDFEEALKGHDSLQYKKSYGEFESSTSALNNTKIELFTTDLNVTDSIVTYQINMTVFKNIKVFHSLTFNASPQKNKIAPDTPIVQTKQLTPYWTYNIIND